MTNDRGEYRLFGITPGLYYVNAGSMVVSDAAILAMGRSVLEGGDAQSIPRPQLRTQIYTLTYYPGVPDLDRAVLIDVRSGEESRADMMVTRGTRHRVGGRVIDSRTGTPPQDVSVSLTYHTLNRRHHRFKLKNRSRFGHLQLPGKVTPAPYTLRAQGRSAPPTGARGA